MAFRCRAAELSWPAAATVSSSTVSMRFLLSGPVSSMVGVPVWVRLWNGNATGTGFLSKFRVLRVVPVFRLLLGIEVIEIAKELIQPCCVVGVLLVALVVFPKLAGRVTALFITVAMVTSVFCQPSSRRADRPWSCRCARAHCRR